MDIIRIFLNKLKKQGANPDSVRDEWTERLTERWTELNSKSGVPKDSQSKGPYLTSTL